MSAASPLPAAFDRYVQGGAQRFLLERSCDRLQPVERTTQRTILARRTRCSVSAGGLLGPLIRNPRTTMGLDCLPKRCPCGNHKISTTIPDGLTHRDDEPCPFASDRFPIGMLATCCSLRGKAAAYELDALGEGELSDRMYRDMTAEEAPRFATVLREAADRLEATYADEPAKPKGAGWGRYLGLDEHGQPIWSEFTTFEDALARIREAARWYEKVGALGFGVDAWS